MFKPMLACDYDPDQLRFPVIVQPKIDGVRGLVVNGVLVGRSLKPFPNPVAQKRWSYAALNGLDGELVAGYENDDEVCRVTSGILRRVKPVEGELLVNFTVFDSFVRHLEHAPYERRLTWLRSFIATVCLPRGLASESGMALVQSTYVGSLEHLDYHVDELIELGYEGAIIRDPLGKYKYGKSTVKEGGLMRIKKFTDAEAIIIGFEEGETNNNPKEINALGLAERSTKKAGKIPNGMVGTIIAVDEGSKQEIKISPGKLTQEERAKMWAEKEVHIGARIKYKYFPKGVKDKPRFPTFQCFRPDNF